MVGSRGLLPLALAALAALATACTSTTSEDESAAADAIVTQATTLERPAVARYEMGYGACTATLVAPNVALTAAHCVKFKSANENRGILFIDRSADNQYDTLVTAYRSFGAAIGDYDVALLRLDRDVPAKVATAMTMTELVPPAGELIAVYGYGCTNRGTQARDAQKRKFTYAFGATTHQLCEGDSGGPQIVESTGAIFAVNQSYLMSPRNDGPDQRMPLAAKLPELRAQIAAWAQPAAP